MTPHALDLTIGLIILLSTLVAYFRGIVRELFMLAGFALAAFVSVKGGHLLVPDVAKWMGTLPNPADEKPTVLSLLKPSVATDVVAYGGVFLLIFILMVVIRMMISHWVNAAGLSVMDKVLGAFFGFLRGYLLVFVIFATCLYMGSYKGDTDDLPDWAKNSVSVPILESTLIWTNKNIDLKSTMKDIANRIEKVNFDKTAKEAGDAGTELKNEVKKEEKDIEKSSPETPPAAVPVPAVTAAPVPAPSAPAAGKGAAPTPDAPAPAPAAPAAAGSPPPGAPTAPSAP